MSKKSRLRKKQKVLSESDSSETSSEDEEESSSSSSSESSESEEEVPHKRAKKQNIRHKRRDSVDSSDEEAERHHRRHKHRKKVEAEDSEAVLRHERAHRKRRRKRDAYHEDITDVHIKQEPLDEMDSLHHVAKRHKSPRHLVHTDGINRSDKQRHPGPDEHRRLDQDEHLKRSDQSDHRRRPDDDHRRPEGDRRRPDDGRRRPDDGRRRPDDDRRRPDDDRRRLEDDRRRLEDDHRRLEDDRRRPDDNHRRPYDDELRLSEHREHQRSEKGDHRRPDRRKQMEERPQHRSVARDTGRQQKDDAQHNGKVRGDRKQHAVKEEPSDGNHEWGKKAEKQDGGKKGATEKEKPNFGLSGKLAEETNTFKGVVLKYSEPPEARKPKKRWRLYPFKGEKCLPTLYVHRQSAYLIGRDRKIADLPVDHPSCSKQHAVFQYRLLPYTREDGTVGRRIRPYIIDLESANGTFLNNVRLEPRKYVEVLERDVIKFGFSSREYVLLHEHSKDDYADEDVQEEPTAE